MTKKYHHLKHFLILLSCILSAFIVKGQSIPTVGLIAYYTFDSSASFIDQTGHGHNGTIYGSPSIVTGMVGNAYYFNGTSDHIDIPSRNDLNVGKNRSLSISLWFKTDKNDTNRNQPRVIISKRTSASDNSDYIIFSDSGSIVWGTGTARDSIAWLYLKEPSINAWHHLVTTLNYDSTASSYEKKVYIDCKLITDKTGYVKADSVTDDLRIAVADKDGKDVFFAGAIDEVRIYNRALSDSEVLTLCSVPSTPLSTTLQGRIHSSKGIPMANSKVFLLKFNSIDTILTAIDSVLTDSNGNYLFNIKKDTTLYLIASPDSSLYPHEIATYYDSAYDFSSAKGISIAKGANNISFNTLYGANLGGNGFITGKITICYLCKNSTSGKPVVGLKVILTDTKGRVQAETYTDKNGDFRFKNISLQKYYIRVDKPYVNNTIAPNITLNATQNIANLEFILYPTYLELEATTTGINSFQSKNETISIYPNPANNNINISFSTEKTSEVSICITDVLGREYYNNKSMVSKGENTLNIQANQFHMCTGAYVVKLMVGDIITIKKLVIYK